jgi:hypothetical protein
LEARREGPLPYEGPILYASGPKLFQQSVEVVDTEVDHKRLFLAAEVVSAVCEWCEHRWARFLTPFLIAAHRVDSELFFIRAAQGFRVTDLEEEATESRNLLHGTLLSHLPMR